MKGKANVWKYKRDDLYIIPCTGEQQDCPSYPEAPMHVPVQTTHYHPQVDDSDYPGEPEAPERITKMTIVVMEQDKPNREIEIIPGSIPPEFKCATCGFDFIKHNESNQLHKFHICACCLPYELRRDKSTQSAQSTQLLVDEHKLTMRIIEIDVVGTSEDVENALTRLISILGPPKSIVEESK